jgi:hypothetical protein
MLMGPDLALPSKQNLDLFIIKIYAARQEFEAYAVPEVVLYTDCAPVVFGNCSVLPLR